MPFFVKKKVNQFKKFDHLLQTNTSFFLLSVTTLTVDDKVELKKELKKLNYDFIVLKNKVFIKFIKEYFPKYQNIIQLVQGFCIIIHPTASSSTEQIDYTNLKKLGSFIEKQQNLFFLGGLLEQQLVNKDFMKKVLDLRNPDSIYQNIINLITYPQQTVINVLQSPSNKIQAAVSNKAKTEN